MWSSVISCPSSATSSIPCLSLAPATTASAELVVYWPRNNDPVEGEVGVAADGRGAGLDPNRYGRGRVQNVSTAA